MFLLRVEGLAFFFCLGTTRAVVSLESREKEKVEPRVSVKVKARLLLAFECVSVFVLGG